MRGILYVAYGEAARREALVNLGQLHYPAAVVSDRPLGERPIFFGQPGPGARWAKLHMDRLSPFEPTAYLDADTRVLAPIDVGFEIIEDGWDLAIAPSAMQGANWLWKCAEEERQEVRYRWGYTPLSLQGGVLFFAKNERTEAFFNAWRSFWRGGQDQAALLMALREAPVRVWLLGRPWNGGSVIAHRFGAARG